MGSNELADFFWELLEAGGDRPALITENESLSYTGLVERIAHFAPQLRARLPEGLHRPLVLLEATNELDSIVAYLTCLRSGYPVILVAEGQALAASSTSLAYRPNLVIAREDGHWTVSLSCSGSAAMHPELALLLSTSGTTGAAKLVRLSAGNLQANAQAIAGYLALTASDRAITALPYHYSYGMSVLHSYLLAHATLVLTSASLVDDELWSLARRHGVTSLALVPTQFELLENIAFSKPERLPTLRYVTQAGGKLEARLAEAFSRRAQDEGWQLFIMYGQTEAGPRMSYVPPEDAQRWHHSIGRPVDGGSFRLLDAQGREITRPGEPGELVYEGPNVMLGYASTRADLANPAGPSVLHTGDIAERVENGYFAVTGRTSRFIKLFGLRISLDEVENTLRAEGQRALVSGSDEALVVFLTSAGDAAALRARTARRYGWPERVVSVVPLEAVPLLPSGKVDYRELARRAQALAPQASEPRSDLSGLLCSALGESSLDLEKSFRELGGNSLSYLEVQLFLSKRAGGAPEGWEQLPLRQLLALERAGAASRAGWQRISADLLARILAIQAVIALHSTSWNTGGGSILLLVLAGYSLARFQSELLFAGRVGKTLWSMLGRIVGVYYVCIAVAALKFSPFGSRWFLLAANFPPEEDPDLLAPYWFVSTYVQIIALASLPFLLPRVRDRVRRAPFEAGVIALFAIGLAVQLTPIHDIYYNIRHRNPVMALELLLAGWCIYFARESRQRAFATAAVLLVWFQNYGLVELNIALILLGGSLSVLWGLRVSLPERAARVLLAFGSLSMFVYLAHVPALHGLSRFVPPGALCFALLVLSSLAGAVILKRASDIVARRVSLVGARWQAQGKTESIPVQFGAAGLALTAEALTAGQANDLALGDRPESGVARLPLRSSDGHHRLEQGVAVPAEGARVDGVSSAEEFGGANEEFPARRSTRP
jgi:acyl-CoA synthetase (AMP-forming)/AMP-acid ligase II/peptidoglycan/LPS O-acetylase OafA/YrhL